MVPFPSKHHCPVCQKKTKSMAIAGHCKKHQWICWCRDPQGVVMTWSENCEHCEKEPSDKCPCGKEKP
jgi:hypothetical protein